MNYYFQALLDEFISKLVNNISYLANNNRYLTIWAGFSAPRLYKYCYAQGGIMTQEISDWISLVALVTSFFAYLEAKKANKTNQAIEALKKVIDVSEKTQTYLQKRSKGEKRNFSTEYQLAEDWSRAAFSISRIDKKLSARLYDKSLFWRNPDTWDAKSIKSKGISLAAVTSDARRIMESYA